MSAMTSTEIDRKTASRLLKVSIRTIDRYVRNGKLSAYNKNGRILLDKREVMLFPAMQDVVPIRHVKTQIRPKITASQNDSFYKDLYEEAKKLLNDYQEKLEKSTYRIGQLESQLNGASLTATKIVERDQHPVENFSIQLYKKDIEYLQKELDITKTKLAQEHANKLVFAILTYVLLALQPVLWYLLN